MATLLTTSRMSSELKERIDLLRTEIERLEKAIEARQATRAAADAAFKI